MPRTSTKWTNKKGEKWDKINLYLLEAEKEKIEKDASKDQRAVTVYLRKALKDKGII